MTKQIARGQVVLGDDFTQHRIKGYVPHAAARGIDPELDVPLISHVEGNLWQGGCMNGVKLPSGFRYVISLYPWERYDLPEGCFRREVRMYDSLDQGFDQVVDLAVQAAEFVRKAPTLVHCQAGLNRSGLLAATILVKHLGKTPAEAISLLRSQRSPLVLCNEAFENWVRGLV